MDVLNGASRLSIQDDEAEEAWRVLTPLVQAWAKNNVPLEEYLAAV